MEIALTILCIVCPLAAVLFVVRLICSLFSSEIVKQMHKHPRIHVIWGCVACVGGLMILGVVYPSLWPPPSIERRAQRQKVWERVQRAGGWEAVRLGCEALVTNYPDGLTWFPPRSNAWVYPNPQTGPRRHYVTNIDYGPLPAAVAALQPKEIRYYPPRLITGNRDGPQAAVVQIKLFGMHSTGGHSTPYFRLEVPCGERAATYEPRPSPGGVSGNRYWRFRKVSDRVFEVY